MFMHERVAVVALSCRHAVSDVPLDSTAAEIPARHSLSGVSGL